MAVDLSQRVKWKIVDNWENIFIFNQINLYSVQNTYIQWKMFSFYGFIFVFIIKTQEKYFKHVINDSVHHIFYLLPMCSAVNCVMVSNKKSGL